MVTLVQSVLESCLLVVRLGLRRHFCFPEPALCLFDRLLLFPSHGVALKRFPVFVTRSGGFPTSSFVK